LVVKFNRYGNSVLKYFYYHRFFSCALTACSSMESAAEDLSREYADLIKFYSLKQSPCAFARTLQMFMGQVHKVRKEIAAKKEEEKRAAEAKAVAERKAKEEASKNAQHAQSRHTHHQQNSNSNQQQKRPTSSKQTHTPHRSDKSHHHHQHRHRHHDNSVSASQHKHRTPRKSRSATSTLRRQMIRSNSLVPPKVNVIRSFASVNYQGSSSIVMVSSTESMETTSSVAVMSVNYMGSCSVVLIPQPPSFVETLSGNGGGSSYHADEQHDSFDHDHHKYSKEQELLLTPAKLLPVSVAAAAVVVCCDYLGSCSIVMTHTNLPERPKNRASQCSCPDSLPIHSLHDHPLSPLSLPGTPIRMYEEDPIDFSTPLTMAPLCAPIPPRPQLSLASKMEALRMQNLHQEASDEDSDLNDNDDWVD
jgi:hypothetical protein